MAVWRMTFSYVWNCMMESIVAVRPLGITNRQKKKNKLKLTYINHKSYFLDFRILDLKE